MGLWLMLPTHEGKTEEPQKISHDHLSAWVIDQPILSVDTSQEFMCSTGV